MGIHPISHLLCKISGSAPVGSITKTMDLYSLWPVSNIIPTFGYFFLEQRNITLMWNQKPSCALVHVLEAINFFAVLEYIVYRYEHYFIIYTEVLGWVADLVIASTLVLVTPTMRTMNVQYECEGSMISRIYLLSLSQKTGSCVDVLIVTWCL